MKFDEFMELYNSDDWDIDRLVIRKYIPLEEKDFRAKTIVDNSYYENGEFKVNSTAKHMLTFLSIVDMYTDIEIDFKDALSEYNQLDESMALDEIVSEISDKDLNEFRIILEMKCNDMITNEYELHSYINKQVERFGELVRNVLKPVIEGLDVEKIIEVLNDNS